MYVTGGLNQAQTFYYVFDSRSLKGEEITDVKVMLDGEEIEGATVGESGEFTVPQGELRNGGVISVVGTVTTSRPMTGQDAIVLTVSKEEDYSDGVTEVAKIKEFEDCASPGSVEKITPEAACIDDGEMNKATFAFEVELSSGYSYRGQVFSYRFDSNKALDDGYEVTAFYINGEKQDVPAKQGSFELPENSFNAVTKLDIQVDV